jgi:serine/threonine-protein kinase HipA
LPEEPVFGLPRRNKYDEDLLRVAEKIMMLGTDQKNDSVEFLKHIVFSWIVGNNDVHLKNYSILKVVYPDMSDYVSITLAPAYDIISSMVYQQANGFGLKLGGKGDSFGFQDFALLGKTMGLSHYETKKIIDDLIENIGYGKDALMQNLPPAIIEHTVTTPNGESRISMDHIDKINRIIEAKRMILRHELEQMPKRGGPKMS